MRGSLSHSPSVWSDAVSGNIRTGPAVTMIRQTGEPRTGRRAGWRAGSPARRGRHVVGLSLNEESRRYVKDPPVFFVPRPWRKPPERIKQGSGEPFTSKECEPLDSIVRNFYNAAEDCYERLLDMDVAPELARMVLPLDG